MLTLADRAVNHCLELRINRQREREDTVAAGRCKERNGIGPLLRKRLSVAVQRIPFADREGLREMIRTIDLQFQTIDRVESLYRLQTIPIDTLFRIGHHAAVLMVSITLTLADRSRLRNEIGRMESKEEADDRVTTRSILRESIAVRSARRERSAEEIVRISLCPIDIEVFLIPRLDIQRQFEDRVATCRRLQAIPINTGDGIFIAVPRIALTLTDRSCTLIIALRVLYQGQLED